MSVPEQRHSSGYGRFIPRRTFLMLLTLLPAERALWCQAKESSSQNETRDQQATKDLQLRMDGLTSRATAVQESLRSLEERLRRRRMALRSDVVKGRTRMEIAMDESERSLKSHRWSDAKEAMDRAETAIGKLEAFLSGKE